jgi:flagellar hook-associated protein 1 FlgK
MASLNTAWEITTSALRADQSALATVANNTANVSTPGYTQQTVQWEESAPLRIDGVLVGSGVTDAGAVSQRDRVLNQAIDQQTQAQASTASRLVALDALQATFAPTASGSASSADISGSIDSFFSSLQQLQGTPADPSLREAVISAADNLSASFNTAASNLVAQQATLSGQATSTVTQINGLSTAIAALNQQIQSSSPSSDAGALEDQRQYDLQGLSKLIGIDTISTERNGLTITTTSGAVLVLGGQASALTTGPSGGQTHIYDGATDITTQLATGGGQLGGLLQVRDGDIPNAMASLDTLANALGTAVNNANAAGSDANGAAGGAIFSLPAGLPGSALGIAVVVTDPLKIAAAASGDGVGDGSNAGVMAGIGQQAIVSGQTPTDYYAGFVSSIGDLTSNVSASSIAQQAGLAQLTTQQSNLSTVSLDGEATDLQNLEQAYGAASKVFTIINTLMGDAINLGTATTV